MIRQWKPDIHPQFKDCDLICRNYYTFNKKIIVIKKKKICLVGSAFYLDVFFNFAHTFCRTSRAERKKYLGSGCPVHPFRPVVQTISATPWSLCRLLLWSGNTKRSSWLVDCRGLQIELDLGRSMARCQKPHLSLSGKCFSWTCVTFI